MTLPRFFAATVAVLGLLAAAALSLAVRDSSAAIVRVAEDARAARAGQVVAAVETELTAAEHAIQDFEQAMTAAIVDDRDPGSVRRYLTGELLALRGLTDLTFTSARLTGYGADGAPLLAPQGRGQVAVFRDRAARLGARTSQVVTPGGAGDPTRHDTFQAAAHRDARGEALWSDLAFTELDAGLPIARRRQTMTVQKAVFARQPGGTERFAGVLRAGLVSQTLDRLGAQTVSTGGDRIFICDRAGRLVTRLAPEDGYALVDIAGRPDPDGDLRVRARRPPPEIAAALARAQAGDLGGNRLTVGETAFLLTLVPIAAGRAQDWLAGVLVPEAHYVGALTVGRRRLLWLLAAALAVTATAGVLGARTVGRGVAALVRSTEAMQRFSFGRDDQRSPFGEVNAALESVERAKTALRAMVKYVPVALVRQLYDSGRDPVPGAETRELSLMFTDIADFTTHAEALAPDRLAAALGRYLDAATAAVEGTGGTVDKYIGDALMVLWNAPAAQDQHAAAACRGALACAAATATLVTSDAWKRDGVAPWRTRFGIHTGAVLVGNFGSTERLNYTAMGDGVNLAARLEGLNKVFGTTILVSEATRRQAGGAFLFRQVDRVAVKGKVQAVAVHELVGLAADPDALARRPLLARYEEALAAVWARRFTEALELLDTQPHDGPSRALAARCRAWLQAPPPDDWDGAWTAPSK